MSLPNRFNHVEANMKYCGIDLHSNNSVVSVIDETDRVVAEKRLPNDLAKILAFLDPWQAELTGVVIESTYNWYWLVDGLRAAGFIAHLANTTAIKKYEGLKHCGDETDARYLAHLLRLGILPTGTILPPEARSVRDLARKRMQLVQNRTTHILAIENITARQHGMRLSGAQVHRLTAEAIDQMELPAEVALAMQSKLGGDPNAVHTDRAAGKSACRKCRSARRVRVAEDCAWHRTDPGNRHSARGRLH
ncbi:IS110 family transposase [Burkholderia ubonensis]|uniref:IS110 family transposase n=1 Tax=Burkholderia ubonensis TaxID=101571 RepID=UPI001E420420|nr:transposase [Burkholderia ubonensis]